ncbi:MAG TPA: tetratricopeptide repeat protein [Bryobacteraceae bacterium]|nr:tetratricopeptide repeat protein [Bryobacteraceae bacterium]
MRWWGVVLIFFFIFVLLARADAAGGVWLLYFIAIVVTIAVANAGSAARSITRAETALKSNLHAIAAQEFEKAVKKLEASKPVAGTPKFAMRQQAYLGLGNARLALNQRPGALQAFLQARQGGATLPPFAEALVAEQYAESGAETPEAFDAYLKYIAAKQESASPFATRVHSVLQSICKVKETMKAADRKTAQERNAKVIAAAPSLDWAHGNLGLALLLDGKAGEARECFERAYSLRADPMTAYWLGVCYWQQAEPNFETGVRWIEKFLQSAAENSRTLKRQAQAAFDIGTRLSQASTAADNERAVRYLSYAVQRAPDNAEYQYALACAYAKGGYKGMALEAFSAAFQKSPQNRDYALRLGLEREKQGQIPEAVEAYRCAIAADPNFPDAHARLTPIYLARGEWAEAEKHARALLQFNPNDVEPLSTLIVALFCQDKHADIVETLQKTAPGRLDRSRHRDAILCAGRGCIKAGAPAKAIEWLSTAGDPEAEYYMSCAYAHAGNQLEALRRFTDIAGSGGTLAVKAEIQRGHLLQARGDIGQAASAYQSVLNRESDNRDALYGLAYLNCQKGQFEDAYVLLQRLLEREGRDPQALYLTGLVSERLGRAYDAIAAYRRVERGPLESKAVLRRGILACRDNNFSGALDLFANEPDRKPDPYLFYKGWAAVGAGKPDAALSLWEELLARHPADRDLAVNIRSAAYLKGAKEAAAGQLEQAIASWERYLSDGDVDRHVERDLAVLHFRHGFAGLNGGSPQGVLPNFEQAQRRDPSEPLYAFYVALCELKLKQFDRCQQRLRSLLDQERSSRTLYHLALCLMRAGNPVEAGQVAGEAALANGAGDYTKRARWLRANLLIQNNRIEDAARELALVV